MSLICGLHANAGGKNECAADLTFEIKRLPKLDPDQALILLKRWAIKGLSISPKDRDSRTQHKKRDLAPRKLTRPLTADERALAIAAKFVTEADLVDL